MTEITEIIQFARALRDPYESTIETKMLKYAICEAYKVAPQYMLTHDRDGDIVEARRVYFYILNKIMKWKPGKVADYVSNGEIWDRCTVMHHSRKCEEFMSIDKKYRQKVNQILLDIDNEKIKMP